MSYKTFQASKGEVVVWKTFGFSIEPFISYATDSECFLSSDSKFNLADKIYSYLRNGDINKVN